MKNSSFFVFKLYVYPYTQYGDNNMRLKLIILFFMFAVSFTCINETDDTYSNHSIEVIIDKNEYSNLELEIIILINKYRNELGINSLQVLNIISSVAQGHTEYMIKMNETNHDNFAYRVQYLMDNAAARTVGENVAFGYNTAEGVFNAWLHSEGHRKIIENANYTHFGISIKTDNNDKTYFTNIFIKK